jgi:hypothetical protein
MALEALEGKIVFSKVSRVICGIFEWLEALARKNRGSCEDWEFFGYFWWIFGVFIVVRTYSSIFFRNEGSDCNSSKRIVTATQFTTRLGGLV